MAVELKCYKCGESLRYPEKVGLREECPKCKSDVHSCRNCDFHDPKVYNECRETQAEVQRERDRANRCDFYRPRSGGPSEQDKAAALRAAAEALFKKKS